jgi:hypothetical protein
MNMAASHIEAPVNNTVQQIKTFSFASCIKLIFSMDFDFPNRNLALEKLYHVRFLRNRQLKLSWFKINFLFSCSCIQEKNGKLTEIYVNLGLIFLYYNQILSVTFAHYCTKLEETKLSYRKHNLAELFYNCFPLVRSWSFSFKLPTVLGKHCWTPFPLVAFYYVGGILMKSLTMPATDLSKVAWKKIQMIVKEVPFE